MSFDPVVREHQEWLGFLQPVGLVVSPTALKNAQARIARNVTREQEILLRHTREGFAGIGDGKRKLTQFSEFAKEFWGWEETDIATPPDTLNTALQEYSEVLRPDHAVPGVNGESEWLMLIQELPPAHTMDQGGQSGDERSWQASPQARFERLLRDTNVPIGLLVNQDAIRVVYAPRGETAGHLTFPIQAMCETAGRPMVAALHLLLDAQRLFALPKEQRLPAILQASRRYQNEVSIQLAEQVLRALNELCRGLNDANRSTRGALLQEMTQNAPEEIYGGLLTTLMRLVFLLYAEDRNLMAQNPKNPMDSAEVYQRFYGLIGLHEKLREDAAAYPDTMDQRFGAWAQFLTLSRLVHDGGGHGDWRLPARRGRLFDPDAYPFLEGRPYKSHRVDGEKLTPPKISDGVLYRVLEDLLYLEGERISYRALDVEQIGSVYEAMMGFAVEVAKSPSIGFKPDHVVVDLNKLLEQTPGERKKWLKENVGWEPAERAAQALKAADSAEAVLSALNNRISLLYSDRERGPLRIAPGDIYLQPTEERRRSGSHYTPRSLTEPIVRTTLDPVLQQLGENPTPERILDLKVCDPAMGSGAFLVEACRYLGDALVKAWAAHKVTPDIPADQDPLLHARRVIAQRCLYGVDKNPFAVDLAKLSLWLATFAKDHPFTFLDHSLRHGDSLVGLAFEQMVDALGDGSALFRPQAEARVAEAIKARRSILNAVETTPYDLLETKYQLAVQSVGTLRDLGDAIVAAFFQEDKPKERTRRRNELVNAFENSQFDVVAEAIHSLRTGKSGVTPFHWETELPEVFSQDRRGFDALVGNPPFLGGKKISTNLSTGYRDWLANSYEHSNSNSDLVSYFFRRAFGYARTGGALGLIATNSVFQGATRATGLYYIVKHGGVIYAARKRVAWPGEAAVVVCVVHAWHGLFDGPRLLNGVSVTNISAFLVEKGGDDDPFTLAGNAYKSFIGYELHGKGFMFDDRSAEANAMSVLQELADRNPDVRSRVSPFIGGEEVNENPLGRYSRLAINFGTMTLEEAQRWPELVALARERVKPKRTSSVNNLNWWQYKRPRAEMASALEGISKALVCVRHSVHFAMSFQDARWVLSDALVVFAFDDYAAFSILQSRVHEIWAVFFGSSIKDDPRYSPTLCFETFPFPNEWIANEALNTIGEEYYLYRSDWMTRNQEGMTAVYNRFHDKYEDGADIQKLRDLHAQMDRVVLDAYGWSELLPVHDFILDYEEAEDEEDGGKRRRKEPWRYRWTDEFRDEVLARLLDLNRERAEDEKKAGAAMTVDAVIAELSAKNPSKRARKKKDVKTIGMYSEEAATE